MSTSAQHGGTYGSAMGPGAGPTAKVTQAPPPPYSEFTTGALNAGSSSLSVGGSLSPRPHLPPHPQASPHVQHFPRPGPPYPHTPASPGYPNPNPNGIRPTHHPSPYPYPYNPNQPPPHHPQPAAYNHNHQFGPTPLNDQQLLLPYAFYTERAVVDARARWRLCEALLVALGIYLGVALLVGVEVFGDGWWTFGALRASA